MPVIRKSSLEHIRSGLWRGSTSFRGRGGDSALPHQHTSAPGRCPCPAPVTPSLGALSNARRGPQLCGQGSLCTRTRPLGSRGVPPCAEASTTGPGGLRGEPGHGAASCWDWLGPRHSLCFKARLPQSSISEPCSTARQLSGCSDTSESEGPALRGRAVGWAIPAQPAVLTATSQRKYLGRSLVPDFQSNTGDKQMPFLITQLLSLCPSFGQAPWLWEERPECWWRLLVWFTSHSTFVLSVCSCFP